MLDHRIWADSEANYTTDEGSEDYAILTSLATRQALGATQLVGTPNKKYLFLKEISSNGNVQTADVIYPSSPIFLYLNPELLKLMLDPLFDNQEAGHYPHEWALHDLGFRYPNATGHPDGNDEQMPIEESANMLILTLAYVQRTGNLKYLDKHYTLLKRWANYLIPNTCFPANQLSTDDFSGYLANQTNLALKGIIGIHAMSEIASLTHHLLDSKNYNEIASDYATQWKELAKANDGSRHYKLTFNDPTSRALMYNLYAAGLINDTTLFPRIPNEVALNKYGIGLDSRNPELSKADWNMFFAAAIRHDHGNKKAIGKIINSMVRFVNETPTSVPWTDLYNMKDGTHHGASTRFMARPVLGAMFALLVLPPFPTREQTRWPTPHSPVVTLA